METTGFQRAFKYLSYAGGAKWLSILAGLLSSVIYVLLLAILALFFDLLITHGRIPNYANLSPNEQLDFARRWGEIPEEQRRAAIEHLGFAETKAAEHLSGTELPPILGKASEGDWVDWARRRKVLDAIPLEAVREQEVRWRAYIFHTLTQKVSPEAAALYQPRIEAGMWATQSPLTTAFVDRRGFGVLATVVHQRNSVTGSVLALIARVNPWMWSPGEQSDPNQRYLTGLLVLATSLVALRGFLLILMNRQAAVAGSEAGTRLRRAVYHQVARLGNLGVRDRQREEGGDLFTSQIDAVEEALKVQLTHIYRYPLQFFLCLVLAFLAHPLLALTFLLFGSLVWIMGGQLTAAFRRQSQRASARMTARQTQLIESLGMMRLVKGYLMELFNQSRIERQLGDYAEANQLRSRGETFARPVFLLLASLGSVALLYLAGRLILADGTDLVNLLVLLISFASLYVPISARFEYRRLVRRGREAARGVFELIDRKGDLTQIADAEFLQPLSDRIDLIDVSVREPGTTHMLLRNVSLTIRAGTQVAIVGAAEEEKLALVSLLPRFFDPSAGELKIDGRNLKWVSSDSLRMQIAMVLEEHLVFNDSVRNNIGCGEANLSLPQIVEAAKLAHAHQFILKLPHGYETQVGELGYELGPVERFQIGLARALLRDPALLVIQEPRGTLTDESKILIDDTLQRVLAGRTVIYLAHRVSTLRHCDEVVFLHEGRVEAIGPHRELLKSNPRYQHLYYLEFNHFTEQAAG